jgi:hypothetical protein
LDFIWNHLDQLLPQKLIIVGTRVFGKEEVLFAKISVAPALVCIGDHDLGVARFASQSL